MPIISSGLTDIGLKRQSNQDTIFLSPQNNLFIVADGMGGHNGGDIASNLAIETIPEYFKQNIDKNPLELTTESILHANKIIFEKSISEPKLKGMGTTIVLLFFRGDTLYVGNVGDSRAYLVNKGKLFQLSRDHSLVQEKINVGLYSRQNAADDPMKNVLVRTVGYEDTVLVDVYTYKVTKNDILFICSDGLHGKVSDADIVFIINKHIQSPENATPEMVQETVSILTEQAKTNGGQDNISVIMAVAK